MRAVFPFPFSNDSYSRSQRSNSDHMNNGKIGLGLYYLSFSPNINLNVELIIKCMSVFLANHLSGSFLPSVECPVGVIAKP